MPPCPEREKPWTTLARGARRGDARASARLLERHLPYLRAFVRLRAGEVVRARESCSDFVQSVCLEALAELPEREFPTEAAFRHWLCLVAERKIVDRARYWQADKRDPAREVGSLDSSRAAPDRSLVRSYAALRTPSGDAITHEELERLERAIDALPAAQRDVIVLARIVGLSHAEIAARLGKSEGAARTMLCRALAELSERLQERGAS